MSSDFFPSAMLCQFSCGVSRSPLCGVNSKISAGGIHFRRSRWYEGSPVRYHLTGANWRDNVNFIRARGYDEQ